MPMEIYEAMQSKKHLRFACCLSLLAASAAFQLPRCCGQESEFEHKLTELIGQLESPVFAVREQATATLIGIGEPAVEHLSTIPKSATFEARERGKIIERQVAAKIFEQRSRRFLLDLDPTQSYQLPGWNAFRKLVGSTRTSKLLFLEMLKQDRELAQLVERADLAGQMATGAGEKQAKLAELNQVATRKAERLQARLFSLPTPEAGESLGILFAAAYMEEMSPVEVNQLIVGVSQMSFHGYLRKQGYRECVKKLLAAWLPKTHAAMAPEAMRMSLSLDLPVVAPIARQHLTKNFDVSTRAVAFHCLAKFGDSSDVARLIEFTDETTIVEEFSESVSGITEMRVAPPGVPFIPGQDEQPEFNNSVVRINDLAAVSAMLLLDEDPVAIFPNYSHDKSQLIYTHDLAISEKDSPKQIALIKAWAQAHAPAPPKS